MAEKVSRDRGYCSDTLAIWRDMGPLSLHLPCSSWLLWGCYADCGARRQATRNRLRVATHNDCNHRETLGNSTILETTPLRKRLPDPDLPWRFEVLWDFFYCNYVCDVTIQPQTSPPPSRPSPRPHPSYKSRFLVAFGNFRLLFASFGCNLKKVRFEISSSGLWMKKELAKG